MHKRVTLSLLSAAAMTILMSACHGWPPLGRWLGATQIPVTVVRSNSNVPARPTSPSCTTLPPGMALTATVQSSGVVVEIVGLQPGELPRFDYFHARPGQDPEMFDITPGQRVGSDGRAIDASLLRTKAIGAVPELWDVSVVHARGVACTLLTIP